MAEQAQIIRWEDPPPTHNSYPRITSFSRYAAVADELRANPGRYAVVAEGAHGTGLANHIKTGSVRCFTPAGDFDATFRVVNGVGTVYAAYLGDGDA